MHVTKLAEDDYKNWPGSAINTEVVRWLIDTSFAVQNDM